MSKSNLNVNNESKPMTLDDLLQAIEHAKMVTSPPLCAIWSKKAFLRWREAGACNFTDEQINTAGERGGFICDDRGIKLYLDMVVELDKLTLKNNLFS